MTSRFVVLLSLVLLCSGVATAAASPAQLISDFRLKHGEGRVTMDAALNGIANAQMRGGYSPELVSMIIEAVEHDPETRFTSVQALGRCGRNAAEVAIPILSRIALDDHETPQIRRMAEGAIDYIRRSAQ